MTRARAEALVLVNWKGVFYERYLLDRHVTALEGANGAGKTTVMIAAYVVLLPDMSRLRFTNLGETTGGDRGIWGRLGEIGRPSYAALDFALPGARRLIAGVHLERKGEPSVEPTPFLVSGLGPTVRLQDLLLLVQADQELVPELPELRENAARLGGRLQVFASERDYFAALFDQGVTPLRLGTAEERDKLNDMLRTSMTGGISRALTSELRSFLLKEEGGLADTLHRMKANLDACRRTRTEVEEARHLEREIGGVYEAGQAMFAAAVAATRERADELLRRVTDAEATRDAAREDLSAGEDVLGQVIQGIDRAEGERAEVEAEVAQRRDWLERLEKALAAADEVARSRKELARVEEAALGAARVRDVAARAREARRAELERARDAYKRAAMGLADTQRGLDELHRRANAYVHVVRGLAEARALLERPDLGADDVPPALAASRTRIEEVDRERREAARKLADASVHRKDHTSVLAALTVLMNGPVAPALAHPAACDALRHLRELGALAGRTLSLVGELASAKKAAARQEKARDRARALGVETGDLAVGDRVRSLLDEEEQKQKKLADDLRAAQIGIAGAERSGADARARLRDLTEREPIWRDAMERTGRVGHALGLNVVDRMSLDGARAALGERLTEAKRREDDLARLQEDLASQARELLAAGGPFDPDLLRLRDELSGELLAARFEDVGLDEAGVIEARLGPLARALVVDDPGTAARRIGGRSEGLASVWLVSGEAEIAPAPEASSTVGVLRDVIVNEGPALRVSRVPNNPKLGRKAREKRAAELRVEADARAAELDVQRGARRSLERICADADTLLERSAVWLAGDPAPQIVEARSLVTDAAASLRTHREAAAQSEELARILRPRWDGLRALLADAFLLDPPDHTALAEQLVAEHDAALAAQVEVSRCTPAANVVEARLDVLRAVPLSDADIEELGARRAHLDGERDLLFSAIDALEHVMQNREALGWEDAGEKLTREQALVPALQEQLERAEEAMGSADGAARGADDDWESATTRWQEADGRRLAVAAEMDRAEQRLLESGIAEPTANAVTEARAEVESLDAKLRGLGARLGELLTERGRRETERNLARQRLTDADAKLSSARREAEPAVERWDRLRASAQAHNVLASVLATRSIEAAVGRGSVNLSQEAAERKVALLERLRLARGGDAVLGDVERMLEQQEQTLGEAYLQAWLGVREWLRRRVPAQVAEVDDPLEALHRLRDRLAGLSERLGRQEADLRGASEDVARGIDVQIRKARGQVTRLNRNLDGVSFGSIHGIRVRPQAVERMEQVLRALREGAAQALLFQADLPIEEALDEIFRRYGGGRTGGQRLLDYREYIHLQVEIRRRSGADWEAANPTRLSTGEAIGVGAALMMVVLTEWERDANLLRGKRSSGSLRFLFLDEANRLSHDNLGVLFDLCQMLDLQLLIAAPEVARAEGNTTYRLIRRLSADGREEVLVSGRRTTAEA